MSSLRINKFCLHQSSWWLCRLRRVTKFCLLSWDLPIILWVTFRAYSLLFLPAKAMQNNFRKFEELVFCDLWFPVSLFPDSGFRILVSDSRFWFPIPDSGFRFRIPVSGFLVLGLPLMNDPRIQFDCKYLDFSLLYRRYACFWRTRLFKLLARISTDRFFQTPW